MEEKHGEFGGRKSGIRDQTRESESDFRDAARKRSEKIKFLSDSAFNQELANNFGKCFGVFFVWTVSRVFHHDEFNKR